MPQVTETDLRERMRDKRYRDVHHPAHREWVESVTDGWRTLVEAEGEGDGAVQVRAYTQQRNGKAVQIGSHMRGDPPGGEAASSEPMHPAEQAELASRSEVVAAYRLTRQCVNQFEQDRRICLSPLVPSRYTQRCMSSAMARQDACARGAYVVPLFRGYRN